MGSKIFYLFVLILIVCYVTFSNVKIRKFFIGVLILFLYVKFIGMVTSLTNNFLINRIKFYDSNFTNDMCSVVCSTNFQAINVYCLLIEELKAFFSINIMLIIFIAWIIYCIIILFSDHNDTLFTKTQVRISINKWSNNVNKIFVVVATTTLIISTYTSYFMPIDLGQGNVEIGSSLYGIVYNLVIICVALILTCFSSMHHLFPVLEFYRTKIINKIKDYYERKTK